jgi:signal peptidase II
MNRIILLAIVGIVLVFADQVSKDLIVSHLKLGDSVQVIPGFFNLASVRNEGAAFGFGNQSPFFQENPLFRVALFLGLPVAFCFYILYVFYKTRSGSLHMSVAYMLILAGATGNLIDRFRLGYVVDFLMFYWKKEENHFHVFNIADSCVTIAAFLLIYDFFLQLKKKKEDPESPRIA